VSHPNIDWTAPGRTPEGPLRLHKDGWRVDEDGNEYRVEGFTVNGEKFTAVPEKELPPYEPGGANPEWDDAILKESVEHPDHYNQLPKETIVAIQESMSEDAFEGYLQGNVLKYILRFRHKGMALKDLMKAKWYLERMIEGREE